MSMERIGYGSMKSSPINSRKQYKLASLSLPQHQLHWHRIHFNAQIRHFGEQLPMDLSGVGKRINKASSLSILIWGRSQMGTVNILHYLVQQQPMPKSCSAAR